ncbi:MAG: hypothetical protein ACR2K6_02850 [Solirubrobacterales bacterium]
MSSPGKKTLPEHVIDSSAVRAISRDGSAPGHGSRGAVAILLASVSALAALAFVSAGLPASADAQIIAQADISTEQCAPESQECASERCELSDEGCGGIAADGGSGGGGSGSGGGSGGGGGGGRDGGGGAGGGNGGSGADGGTTEGSSGVAATAETAEPSGSLPFTGLALAALVALAVALIAGGLLLRGTGGLGTSP